MVRSRPTEHEIPHNAFFSTLLLPHPPYAQISFSALCSWTPSAFVPSSIWQTSHTPTQNILICNVAPIYSHIISFIISKMLRRSMILQGGSWDIKYSPRALHCEVEMTSSCHNMTWRVLTYNMHYSHSICNKHGD